MKWLDPIDRKDRPLVLMFLVFVLGCCVTAVCFTAVVITVIIVTGTLP